MDVFILHRMICIYSRCNLSNWICLSSSRLDRVQVGAYVDDWELNIVGN